VYDGEPHHVKHCQGVACSVTEALSFEILILVDYRISNQVIIVNVVQCAQIARFLTVIPQSPTRLLFAAIQSISKVSKLAFFWTDVFVQFVQIGQAFMFRLHGTGSYQ
jgi:hypothetical protein